MADQLERNCQKNRDECERINDDDHNCMEAKDWQDGVQNRFDHGWAARHIDGE